MNTSNFDSILPEFLVLCNECKSLGFCKARDPKRFKTMNGSTPYKESQIDLRKYNTYQKKVKDLLNHLPLHIEELFTSFNLGVDEENLQKGIAAFQNEAYQVTIYYLEPLLTYHELKCKLALFVASSQFHIGDYNAAGFMFQLVTFSYNSMLEKEVEEVIEICEHLNMEKTKAQLKLEQLIVDCVSEKKKAVFELT